MIDYKTNNLATIGQFRFWCQKILPAVYDDSLSYYELLCKVVEKLNELIEQSNEQSDVIKIIIAQLEELQRLFEQFMESGFDDYYKEQIEKWVNDNMRSIIEQAIKMVFFGLTDDGYFCAYIPISWQGIIFDTVADYDDENYGCLILKY